MADQPATPAASRRRRPAPLYHRFKSGPGFWESARGWWPWLFLVALLVAFGWMFVKPAPPGRVILATGPIDGSYHWFAQRYAQTFAADGVTLELRPSDGSVDNYRMLEDAEKHSSPNFVNSGVQAAIVQSGTCPEGLNVEIKAVASLYLEPLWIFHRGPPTLQLADLRGRRVAVGPDGAGARSLLGRLLKENKITNANVATQPAATQSAATQPLATQPATLSASAAPATQPALQPATQPADAPVLFVPFAGREAIRALRAGEVDAIVIVISPRHPLLKDLLADDTIRLMNIDRQAAYTRRFPFLQQVTIPRGTIDLSKDLPHEDIDLLAPAANLVCRAGTHPAIVGLLVKAAQKAHERGDLISPPGKMPSTQYIEFPIDPAAAEYFKSGPPFLQRVLPFWAAAFVDRMKVLLLPLLTLLIPLGRLAPPIYVWRTRSKIYRWYRVLREIDHRLRVDVKATSGDADATPVDPDQFNEDLAMLNEMEEELSDQKVPLSYMEEYYNLRLHTDFLRRRVERRIGAGRRRGEDQGP